MKHTILIVDDDPVGRNLLEKLLHFQGYELEMACDGPEALTKAAQLIPDVILLDVMMQGMNGFEVCKRLRADPSLAQVPIIMLTALNDRESRLQGIKLGADDFISKPYDLSELEARLRTITNLNRYRRLLTEQAKFEWVVEQVDEAFLILNHNQQIRYANSKARFYLNLPTDELTDETFLDLAAKNYQCEPQEAWTNYFQPNQQVPCYLVRPETSTAPPFWLQVDVMEMATAAEEKYLIHLHDVTANIFAERQRWTFQGQVNHKLKAPIIPITGAIKYIKDNISQMTEANTREFLDMAYRRSMALQSQIEDILKYLNVSNLAQKKSEDCLMADILLTITAVKKMLEIDKIQVFQTNIEEPEKIYVSISRRAIELILTELFLNAKKFNPKKSLNLEVNIALNSDSVCLQICDDGLHLSPEQLASIWIPYYQGEKYFTGETKGMGLGLSMVASLIWEVGGKCRAYNRTVVDGLVIELTLKAKVFEEKV
jgi:DNA-binding response OmpR family regulator